MGQWSILSSLDNLEGRTYVVPLPMDEAISAVGYALQSPGRVVCERTADGRYIARTIKYTPGWAFAFPLLLLFVRRTRFAELIFAPAPGGTGVTIHGSIDTAAAMRLREMVSLVPAR